MSHTLEYDGLSVRYGRGGSAHQAVDDVSLVVRPGTVHGLVGESGSGKSTLAAATVGLVRATSGAIRLDGTEVTRGTAGRRARRRIQLIFQDPHSALDPRMSIGTSIAEAMRASGRRRSRVERRQRVRELLELVDIEPDRYREPPAGFSGGQRQRITIARALAAEPDVIIADEITSALDVSVQGVVLNLLRELQSELNLTMLLISHNLAVVRYVCHTVTVLRHGRVVETGDTERTLSDPQDPYTKALLDAVPVLGERPDWGSVA
ncbi:ABC transporter ATP-binding protein [Amycolatopsis sp. GM8]|uniref:ABC transporter ATP-binding protein n=1 Tax=Amycolatopsis sp. GM8 TaxID=2896530 RepID=UPI001F3714C3|nr:ABC transporter ATP-binding protein [Amycolatopsis sp. GM8]